MNIRVEALRIAAREAFEDEVISTNMLELNMEELIIPCSVAVYTEDWINSRVEEWLKDAAKGEKMKLKMVLIDENTGEVLKDWRLVAKDQKGYSNAVDYFGSEVKQIIRNLLLKEKLEGINKK